MNSTGNDKQNIEQHYQAQLQELKKTMVADVQRMQDEVKRHFAQQKAVSSVHLKYVATHNPDCADTNISRILIICCNDMVLL